MSRSSRRRTAFIELDAARCEACWECLLACPETVLGKVDVWFHRHARIREPERCTGCRRCVKACHSGALSSRADGGKPRGPVDPH